jgi:cbb3-type cytochrome oxidase maturation protein
MDILFLLVPLSVVLALSIMGLLAWAVWSGQFDDIECEGQRILDDAALTAPIDAEQVHSDVHGTDVKEPSHSGLTKLAPSPSH